MECIAAYVSTAQKKELEKKAEKTGMSISCYIKSRLFDNSIRPVNKEKAAQEYYSTKQLSEKINLSPSAIKRLCKSNKLAYYIVGAEYRFKESDVEEFLKKNRHDSIEQETEYLTIAEVAEKLNMTYDTISKYIKTNKLKAIKFNNRYYRVKIEDFEEFVRQNNSGG